MKQVPLQKGVRPESEEDIKSSKQITPPYHQVQVATLNLGGCYLAQSHWILV